MATIRLGQAEVALSVAAPQERLAGVARVVDRVAGRALHGAAVQVVGDRPGAAHEVGGQAVLGRQL